MEIFNVTIVQDDNKDDYYSEGPSYTTYNYMFFTNEKAQSFIKNYIYKFINNKTSFIEMQHIYNIEEYIGMYNCLEQNRYTEAIDILHSVAGIQISVSKCKEDSNKNVILNEKFVEYAHKHNKIQVFK